MMLANEQTLITEKDIQYKIKLILGNFAKSEMSQL
jgi:hypothetical protein